MSVGALSRRITELGFKLLEGEFALDARQHVVKDLPGKRKALNWARGDTGLLISNSPPKAEDYRALLERNEYSYLMSDGGIIQISYMFAGDDIEGHRLNFHPCPYVFDLREFASYDAGLLEYMDFVLAEYPEKSLVFRTPIRFDYDPAAAEEYHPASHLTLNASSCRIPVRAPVSFDTFMKFILENFYPSVWGSREILELLSFAHEADCMSAHDKTRIFLNWSHR